MHKANPFIVFEGIDGAGKATQSALLAKRLRKSGHTVTTFSIPRYKTPMGKLTRSALMGEYGDFLGLSPYLSALPYVLDMTVARDSFIKALKKGIVVSDRFIPSTVGYHAAKLSGKKRGEFIRFIEHLAYRELELPQPTLVIFLATPVVTAEKLLSRRGPRDQHESSAPYQKRVALMYKELAKRPNWVVIECTGPQGLLSPQEIHERVWSAVAKKVR